MATKPKTEELNINEEQDGAATIDLPEDMRLPDEEDTGEGTPRAADGGDEDHPDDSEAVRAARRARRRAKKDLIRTTNVEKDARLQVLQRQNDEMNARLQHMERRTHQNDIGRIDKAIEDKQVTLEYAKMKLAEATNSGDGENAVKAQELMFTAKQELQQLAHFKRQADQQGQQQNQPQQQQIDPSVQRNAATWIERNGWYKPDLSDTDSKIAKQIDEVLVKEGWNPGSGDYWDELDSRLQKYLPHRYNQSSDKGDSIRSPRNTVGSSGREASAAYGGTNRSTYVLSPERVRAMKEAGIWENVDRKKAAIAGYMKYDRNNPK
jgi:hypothetical protein